MKTPATLRTLSWLLVMLGCLSGSHYGRAQNVPVGSFSLLKPRSRPIVVPFEQQRNLIIVEARLNGQGPFKFMLDTGVGTSIITDPHLKQQLGLQSDKHFRVLGVGEEAALDAFVAENITVELPGAAHGRLSMIVLSDDVLDLSGYVGTPVHGILGSEFFRNLVVRIEPTSSQLLLFDPNTYKAPKGNRWTSLNLEMDGPKAYITTAVQTDSTNMPLRLVLDTGAGHALSLETGSHPQLQLPAQRLRSQLGRGLNGFVNGYLGRVGSMQLGRYQVTQLLTSFPDADEVRLRANGERHGNVGFELLKRFTTVIDYPHNQLLLRPNELYRDPFEHDMCGLELLATGPDYREYVVVKVQPDSPAAQAQLRTGDQIIALNLLPANTYSLTQISRLLHSADGRQLLLLVRRPDGELHSAVVKLKRQI